MKTAVIFLVLFLAYAVSGQNATDLPIIGDISQIKGMTKVYVSGATADDRKMILKVFDKDKTFTVVGDPSQAEFFMEFRELSRVDKTAMLSRDYQERQEAVVSLVKDGKRTIVWQDTETYVEPSGMPVSFPNAWNLTKNFIKAYKKANKR